MEGQIPSQKHLYFEDITKKRPLSVWGCARWNRGPLRHLCAGLDSQSVKAATRMITVKLFQVLVFETQCLDESKSLELPQSFTMILHSLICRCCCSSYFLKLLNYTFIQSVQVLLFCPPTVGWFC